MSFDKYQALAEFTAGAYVDGQASRMVCAALGLAGEAGEVANKVKKDQCHEHPGMEADIMEELGDVLWYAAELCSAMSINMNTVAIENLLRLAHRYPEGYDTVRSVERDDA
jgi:NTP pyrophosphatase (non-canonical NTP hydrolase)